MEYRTSDLSTELLKLQPRGQVTIPASFRRALGLDSNSFIRASIQGGSLVLSPAKLVDNGLIRSFTKQDIEDFVKEDQLTEGQQRGLSKLKKNER